MRLFNGQKRCNQPETDNSRAIFWCVKLPSLHQWHEEKYAIKQGSEWAFAKTVETKIEDDVNGWQTDKMWKKGNNKQIGVIYILYNLY